jgi:hypothetical protein
MTIKVVIGARIANTVGFAELPLFVEPLAIS